TRNGPRLARGVRGRKSHGAEGPRRERRARGPSCRTRGPLRRQRLRAEDAAGPESRTPRQPVPRGHIPRVSAGTHYFSTDSARRRAHALHFATLVYFDRGEGGGRLAGTGQLRLAPC